MSDLIIIVSLGVTTWLRCPPWVQGGWVPKWGDYLLASNARCLYIFRLSAWHLLLFGESRPAVGDNILSMIEVAPSVLHQMHTLYVFRCTFFLSAESQILYYVRLYVFSFQYCILMIPVCGTSFIQDLYVHSVYLYSVFYGYISILFISSYIDVVYHTYVQMLFISAVYSFSEYYFVSAWLVTDLDN